MKAMSRCRSLPNLLVEIAAFLAGVAVTSCQPEDMGSCPALPPPKDIQVGRNVACAIAAEGITDPSEYNSGALLFGGTCQRECLALAGGGVCSLPDDFIAAFRSVQPGDAGGITILEAGLYAGPGPDAACPYVTGNVKVTCSSFCSGGRRTAGIDGEPVGRRMSAGDYFAACCYLEAVSVHAFARLEAELASHGAPRELLRGARRARGDEVRHVRLTRDLARRFDAQPRTPPRPRRSARTLFAMARENAVEGCVRETYGAALALIGAARAKDPEVRKALRTIARDECRHAELSWQVAEWATALLGARQRDTIRRAIRRAVAELASVDEEAIDDEARGVVGMPSGAERRALVGALDRRVFAAAS